VLDALAATTSWPSWDTLRSEAGDSPDEAQAVMAHIVRSLLAAAVTRS
jgi:hypothetical protein